MTMTRMHLCQSNKSVMNLTVTIHQKVGSVKLNIYLTIAALLIEESQHALTLKEIKIVEFPALVTSMAQLLVE